MSHYKIDPKVLVGVPTLMDRPLSWKWTDAYLGMAFPLGCSMARKRVQGKEIGLARNIIVEEALSLNADYVLFISDDVLPPQRVFEDLAKHKKDMVTGVYWTKNQPTKPYIFKDMMKGPFEDWKYGEFFEIDWAGVDCLLVHTDVFRKIEPPWFSTDWTYNENQPKVHVPTEDLYFYTKTRKAGIKLWCDTAVQCGHEDRNTGMVFGLTSEMPQVLNRNKDWKLYEGKKQIADIGCGRDTPYFGKNVQITRIDGDPEVKPDIQCDIRSIPLEKEKFDVVHARHVLEHFYPEDVPGLIAEWCRILKIGGELIINVPDLAHAAREIVKADTNPYYDATYGYWQMYGAKDKFRPEEMHKGGFTKNGLMRMAAGLGYLKDVEIKNVHQGQNIELRAVKAKSSDPYAILPNWYGEPEKKKPKPKAKVKSTVSVGENGKILKPKTKKVKV